MKLIRKLKAKLTRKRRKTIVSQRMGVICLMGKQMSCNKRCVLSFRISNWQARKYNHLLREKDFLQCLILLGRMLEL